MKWIRLWVEETLRGTTFKELNCEERGVWFSLLVMAGDGRNLGTVELRDGVGWSVQGLAEYLGTTTEILETTLHRLQNVYKVDIDNHNRIVIKNWDKYQTSYEKRKMVHIDTGVDKEGEGEEEGDKERESPYSPQFITFWLAYPKKIGKGAAYGAWRKINPSAILAQQMISAVKRQKETPQWLKNDGEFIPHPATWLNQRRWEDELSETKPW
jgi:hypothetical protein